MKISKTKILQFKKFLIGDFVKLVDKGEISYYQLPMNELTKLYQLLVKNVDILLKLRLDLMNSNKYSEIFNADNYDYSRFNDIKINNDIVIPDFKEMPINRVKSLDEVLDELLRIMYFVHEELYVNRRKRIERENSKLSGFYAGTSDVSYEDFNLLKSRIDLDKYPFLYSKTILDKPVDAKKFNLSDELCIIAKFSKLNSVIDKNKQRSLFNIYNLNNKLEFGNNIDNKMRVENTILQEIGSNMNEYLSGTASLAFVYWAKLITCLDKMLINLLDKTFQDRLINEMKINNVFLIINGFNQHLYNRSNGLPSFNKIYDESGNFLFSINILNLDDFCTIFSSLKYESDLMKQFKLNHVKSKLLDYNYNLDWTSDMNFNKILFLKYLNSIYNIDKSLFCFCGSNWRDVRMRLLDYGLDINKGDSVKRGLLSPVTFELSMFLDTLLINGYKDIVTSFNLSNKSFYENVNINKTGINNYNSDNLINMFINHFNELDNNFKLNSVSENHFNYVNKIFFSRHIIRDNILFSIINNYVNFHRENNKSLEFDNPISEVKPSRNRRIITMKPMTRGYSTLVRSNVNTDKYGFYKELENILNSEISDPYLTQSKIEKEWLTILSNDLNKEQKFLRTKTRSILDRALESSETSDYQKIMKRLVRELTSYFITKKFILIALVEIVENYKTLRRTNIAKNIGYSLIRELYIDLHQKNKDEINRIPDLNLNDISLENISLTNFIELIAYHLKNKENIKLNDLISLDSRYIKEYLDSKEDLDKMVLYRNYANDLKITLGLRFIELFTNRPNNVFIEESESTTSGLEYVKLSLSEHFKDLLLDSEMLMLRPKNLPMVCQPLTWGDNVFGGYLENKYIKEDVITGSVKYNAHKFLNRQKLYNTINYFNNIQFGINNTLLEYILNEGQYLIESLDEETKFNSNISLKIANLFKNIPFYLNTHADWRGRIYTHCFYITYQGSELSSALLEFWRGERLTDEGLKIFYAYGASLFSNENNNKVEETRVLWVERNKDNILNMEPEFIQKAESPISFAAFCLEVKNLEKNRDHKIKMPVFIDATCSGIQHISALIGDVELAKKVNLIHDSNNEKPEDFYLSLVEPLNKAINEYGKENIEYSALSELHLTRKILKQPIMTLNYNVSVFGMKEQLYNKLKVETKIDNLNSENEYNKKSITKIIGHTKDNRPIQLTNRDLIQIAIIIKDVIFIEYPALKMVYDYFIEVSILMKNLRLPIEWVTPTGAVVTQNYVQREKTKLTIRSNKKVKTIVLYKQTNKINHTKQKDGLIPNVIHSLDSSHIIKFINDSSKNVQFSILTVHDCFGTHPNHINDLFYFLKEEFISLYLNDDFLKKFDKNIMKTIHNHYNEDIKIVKIRDNEKNLNKRLITLSIPDKNKTKLLQMTLSEPPRRKDLNYNFIRFSKWMFN